MDQSEVGGALVPPGNDERRDLGNTTVAARRRVRVPICVRADAIFDASSVQWGTERGLTVR